MSVSLSDKKIAFAILVAALGYFVDGYDLAIFSAVRMSSLKSLGLTGDSLATTGAFLLNVQLVGMLLGGLGWGILGDKLGRLQVLFGSITLYSLANIANAYVGSIDQYAVCRFVGGIGLAGEIGAGITLVSELMRKETRGYGTMIVAFVGVLGISIAGLVGDLLKWQNAFLLGGVMGIVLLFLRLSVVESAMFHAVRQQKEVKRGQLWVLFGSRKLLARYAACICVGSTFYIGFVVIAGFTPEIGQALGIVEPLKAGQSIFYECAANAVGNFIAGYASQKLQSRKKMLLIGIAGICLAGEALLNGAAHTAATFYALVSLIGFFMGCWAILISMFAEQFGTNLRATAATSLPNLVRAFGILHTSLFIALKPIVGMIPAVEIILVSFTILALAAWWFLPETFGIDLNFVETDTKKQHR